MTGLLLSGLKFMLTMIVHFVFYLEIKVQRLSRDALSSHLNKAQNMDIIFIRVTFMFWKSLKLVLCNIQIF